MPLFRALILSALLFATPTTHADETTAPELLNWIIDHSVEIDTVEAGNGFEDLGYLADSIGDARIISLGEATHGTREFFQMKHRMLEYLVTELDFNVSGVVGDMKYWRFRDDELRIYPRPTTGAGIQIYWQPDESWWWRHCL